jgi:hypothetical protein
MTDPFGDGEYRYGHDIWTVKHTIYEQLSLSDLPPPFKDFYVHYGVCFVPSMSMSLMVVTVLPADL